MPVAEEVDIEEYRFADRHATRHQRSIPDLYGGG